MSGHTPGPWRLDPDSDRAGWLIRAEDGTTVARLSMLGRGDGGPTTVKEVVANRAIIASAPTLAADLAATREQLSDLQDRADKAYILLAEARELAAGYVVRAANLASDLAEARENLVEARRIIGRLLDPWGEHDDQVGIAREFLARGGAQ